MCKFHLYFLDLCADKSDKSTRPLEVSGLDEFRKDNYEKDRRKTNPSRTSGKRGLRDTEYQSGKDSSLATSAHGSNSPCDHGSHRLASPQRARIHQRPAGQEAKVASEVLQTQRRASL